MKKIIFSLAFLLIGSFAMANNYSENYDFEQKENLELVKNDYEIVKNNPTLGCLLKFTFVLEDGTQVVRYYYVEQSCKEFFASIQ